MMNRTSIVFASAVAAILPLASCGRTEVLPQATTYELRQFRATEVFIDGGTNPEAQALFNAYSDAISIDSPGDGVDTSKAITMALENCGIPFPEGASVIMKATDGLLLIRHQPTVLDTIEQRFGFEAVAFRPIDKTLHEDPFNQSAAQTEQSRTSEWTPTSNQR